jgi:nicotinamide-nucleotide amidase
VDSNSAVLGRAVETVGWRVARRATVGDDTDAITSAVRDGLARCGAVICTGGLGPTRDDVTKKAVAALFARALRLDEELWRALEQRWQHIGARIPQSNRSQAEVPDGAEVFANPRGTAPGLALEDEAGRFCVLLPGVPAEMRGLLETQVLPWLARRGGAARAYRRLLRTTGIAESAIADSLAETLDASHALEVAYLPDPTGVDLRLSVWAERESDATKVLDGAERCVRDRLGAHVYEVGARDLAEVVGDLLRQHGFRIAVAESCTAGLVGERLTAIAGSSDYFWGGVIAYDNAAKIELLGVAREGIERHGAVSEEVAAAMATGVRKRAGVDVGLAVTGIAGPGGGTPKKPVGTVWLAIASPAGDRALLRVLPGDRAQIRIRAAQAALDLVRRTLLGLAG